MKKLLSLILGATLVFSCTDQLEEIQPQNSVSDFVAFSDGTTALGTLMGVYSSAQDGDVLGGTSAMVQEFQSDNVEFLGSFPTFNDVKNYVTLSDNGSTGAIYRDNFRLILTANNVIANIPLVADEQFQQATRDQYVAEAKFLRALAYFNLVNMFGAPYSDNNGAGLGVPIVTEAFTGDVILFERATTAEVHGQIIQDLNEALPDLPTSFSAAEGGRGRATQGAVRAFFARLHLIRGEYPQAADFAGQLINNPDYELGADYSFFGQDTDEHIFLIQNSTIDGSSWATWFNGADLGARGDAPFSQDLLDAHDPADRRLTDLSVQGVNADDGNSIFTTKFPDAVNNSDDSPVFRITEMYLTRAEALAETNGINQESIDLINDLRARAGLADVAAGDFATPADLITLILDERRKELAFEGHRRNDLLRRRQGLRPAGDANFADAAFGQPKTLLPIPQREVDLNPNLVQNAGY